MVLARQNFLKDAGETILKQIVKSHNDNIKVVKEQVAQFDAELSALRDVQFLENTTILCILQKELASEKFSTYVQTQAGAEWSSVKTQRTAWTEKLAERLQDEIDQQEEE